MEYKDFEPYLVYNEAGEIIGIKQDAPVEIKLNFETWFVEEKDKQRLANLYN